LQNGKIKPSAIYSITNSKIASNLASGFMAITRGDWGVAMGMERLKIV
jgi:hypothetical protein